MKYETPELTALTPAIEAIQNLGGHNKDHSILQFDGKMSNEATIGYADWE